MKAAQQQWQKMVMLYGTIMFCFVCFVFRKEDFFYQEVLFFYLLCCLQCPVYYTMQCLFQQGHERIMLLIVTAHSLNGDKTVNTP